MANEEDHTERQIAPLFSGIAMLFSLFAKLITCLQEFLRT